MTGSGPRSALALTDFLGQAQTQRVTHTHEVNQGPTRGADPVCRNWVANPCPPRHPTFEVTEDQNLQLAISLGRHRTNPLPNAVERGNAGTRPSLGRPSALGVSRFLGTVLDLNVEPSEVSVDPG